MTLFTSYVHLALSAPYILTSVPTFCLAIILHYTFASHWVVFVFLVFWRLFWGFDQKWQKPRENQKTKLSTLWPYGYPIVPTYSFFENRIKKVY